MIKNESGSYLPVVTLNSLFLLGLSLVKLSFISDPCEETASLNLSTEWLQWRPKLWQMLESKWCMCALPAIHKGFSLDWSKRCTCALPAIHKGFSLDWSKRCTCALPAIHKGFSLDWSKWCMCALPAIHKGFSLDWSKWCMCVMTLHNFPPFVTTKCHFRWSE